MVEKILEIARERQESGEYKLPHARSDLAAKLHDMALVDHEEFLEDGIVIEARFDPGQKARWESTLRKAGLLPPITD